MKCQEIGGERKADFVLKVDGTLCEEFNSIVATDGAFCSWIPAKDGQKLSVEGGVNGTTTEVQVDLIVDGILRNTAKEVHKGPKTIRRPIKFMDGYYEDNEVCFQAQMKVHSFSVDAHPAIMTPNQDTVGKIELMIYILRDENEARHEFGGKTFMTADHWREYVQNPSFTVLRPTQEIDFVRNKNQFSKRLVYNLKKNANASRIGSQPWAVLRFFYRTADAIANASLIPAGSKHEFNFVPPAMTVQASNAPDLQASTVPVAPSMLPDIEPAKPPAPELKPTNRIYQPQPTPEIEANIERTSTAMSTLPESVEGSATKPVKAVSKKHIHSPSVGDITTSAPTLPASEDNNAATTFSPNGLTATLPTLPINDEGTKRPGNLENPTSGLARKRNRSECLELEALIAHREQLLAEKRAKRIACELAAKNAETVRISVLEERLAELEREIGEEDDLMMEYEVSS